MSVEDLRQIRNAMQEITYDNISQILLETIPEFRADEEDVADHRGTFVFEDLARFVKALVEKNDDELMWRIFRFLEVAGGSTDARVLDAVRYSFLEALADSPYHLKLTKKYMGSQTRKLLKDSKRFVN
jgi:hypothetical protein